MDELFKEDHMDCDSLAFNSQPTTPEQLRVKALPPGRMVPSTDCWACPSAEVPQCAPLDVTVEPPDVCDCEFTAGQSLRNDFLDTLASATRQKESSEGDALPLREDRWRSRWLAAKAAVGPNIEPCIANGKRPQESNFQHCPTPQSYVRCGPHHRAELRVLSKDDISELYEIWKWYRDDLTWPLYDKKPRFTERDFDTFRSIAQKVVDAMVAEYREPMVLDQATISNTNHIGHPPHADNVQFDSVWWKGKRIRSEDEVIAAQEGAYVLWRPEKTSYRSYSCTVSLTEASCFEGGEVQFFAKWGDKDPIASYKCDIGCGVAFCGCQRNIHAVTGVKSGFRLVLLVWTRPPEVRVPESQTHVCYFRPGTGEGVWLTTADMQRNRPRKRHRDALQAWMPKEDDEDDACPCSKCEAERQKLSWKDRFSAVSGNNQFAPPSTPTTSAGNSPRTCTGSQTSDLPGSMLSGSPDVTMSPRDPAQHCPRPQGPVCSRAHERVELEDVLSKSDIRQLKRIWESHQDDLSNPWYSKKTRIHLQ